MANKIMKLWGWAVCSVLALTLVLIGCGKSNQLSMKTAENGRAQPIEIAAAAEEEEAEEESELVSKTKRSSKSTQSSTKRTYLKKVVGGGFALLLGSSLLGSSFNMYNNNNKDLILSRNTRHLDNNSLLLSCNHISTLPSPDFFEHGESYQQFIDKICSENHQSNARIKRPCIKMCTSMADKLYTTMDGAMFYLSALFSKVYHNRSRDPNGAHGPSIPYKNISSIPYKNISTDVQKIVQETESKEGSQLKIINRSERIRRLKEVIPEELIINFWNGTSRNERDNFTSKWCAEKSRSDGLKIGMLAGGLQLLQQINYEMNTQQIESQIKRFCAERDDAIGALKNVTAQIEALNRTDNESENTIASLKRDKMQCEKRERDAQSLLDFWQDSALGRRSTEANRVEEAKKEVKKFEEELDRLNRDLTKERNEKQNCTKTLTKERNEKQNCTRALTNETARHRQDAARHRQDAARHRQDAERYRQKAESLNRTAESLNKTLIATERNHTELERNHAELKDKLEKHKSESAVREVPWDCPRAFGERLPYFFCNRRVKGSLEFKITK